MKKVDPYWVPVALIEKDGLIFPVEGVPRGEPDAWLPKPLHDRYQKAAEEFIEVQQLVQLALSSEKNKKRKAS